MTVDKLKLFLNAFIQPDERDFSILYPNGLPRRRRGNYWRRQKRIDLYPKTFKNDFDLIGCAFHELTHHLVWERHCATMAGRWFKGQRIMAHGKEFKAVLETLLGTFNYQYRELIKGLIVYNRRKPRLPPRFVPFEKGANPRNPNTTG